MGIFLYLIKIFTNFLFWVSCFSNVNHVYQLRAIRDKDKKGGDSYIIKGIFWKILTLQDNLITKDPVHKTGAFIIKGCCKYRITIRNFEFISKPVRLIGKSILPKHF